MLNKIMKKSTRAQASLGGEAVRLTVSKIITLCITMATTMMLSRFRTLEEYGTYSQLLLVINFVTSMLMLGLPNCINYFLARAESQEERRRFLSVYYTLSTALSVMIGGILVLAVPLIESFFHNDTIRAFIYFLAVFPWTSIIGASIENILVVYRKTRFLMGYRLAHSGLILGTVAAVQWLGFGFKAYMLAFVLVNVLLTVTVYIIAFRLSGGIRFLLDMPLVRSIFTFSIPIGLASTVGTLNAEIDKLLIGYLMDTEQMAIYTNAAKELPLSIVASSITAVLLPQMTRMIKHEKKREAIAMWGVSIELAFIVIAVIVAGVFTFAEDAMSLLYSAKYLPGVSVFRVYTLNLLLRCTYFGIFLNACGQTKKIFWCSILSLILNAILNPIFYWLFGMIGPAIATFLAILVIQQVQLALTSKLSGLRFADVFPWKQCGAVILVNSAFALLFWGIKRVLPLDEYVGSITESLSLGAVWAVLYLLIMKKRILAAWRKLNSHGE